MSNVREDSVEVFSDQDWLLPKVNACGAMLPDAAAQEGPTAEYANAVDGALKQTNEAFNGYGVFATNIDGAIEASRRLDTEVSTVEHVTLLENLPVGQWVLVETLAYATERPSTDKAWIFRASSFFHRIDETTLEVKELTAPAVIFSSGAPEPAFSLVANPDQQQVDEAMARLETGSIALGWVLHSRLSVVIAPASTGSMIPRDA